MSTMLEQIQQLARQASVPRACSVKMCRWAHEWLRSEIGGAKPMSYTGTVALTGVEIYLNEEIPPDRMVFYDQHGEVFDVLMIDMEAVLAFKLKNSSSASPQSRPQE